MSNSQVEIYVRSSPLGEEVGIHWRNISKAEKPNEEPVVLKQRVVARDDGKLVTINALITDTKPSLILARYENKVLLELTGLDAAEHRLKRVNRRISEIVLWVGDETPEVEIQLRKLAACALLSFWQKDSTFLTTIRSAIDFDGLNSFKVNAQQIEQLYTDAGTNLNRLLSEVAANNINTSESIWLTPKTIDIESQLYDLVNQISQTSLPNTEQPVVVVAEFKKEEIGDRQWIIYKGNVWQEKKTPVSTPDPVPPLPPPLPPLPPPPPPSLTSLIVIVRIILILILIAILVLAQPQKALTPVITPIPSPTPTTIPNKKPAINKTSPQSSIHPQNSGSPSPNA
ncbi:hypothetical protein NIES37_00410 [Tolypothrix tenuis PCC 7101]|uniref:Uncharacterized protein n=1 Tax=Tolypothrix tenuis PCC 7101 TaxID=231146 RepID=A0A1Z4MRI9_9CYAN|nr:hypothetical protein [Aulosira sp. FACHB-113]BAY96115.1 hypothetical protein NIES37_00410 [Tolypothrix tenuis PCC 7101]BAZ73378.1 hypothetical protein NIES50_19430 [Aulosira laxa NIES-50]